MTPYIEEIIRPWVLSNTDLNKHFHKFLKKDPNDKFGKSSMKKVYVQVILRDQSLVDQYTELWKAYIYVPDIELVDNIYNIIHQYGWKRFFMALRFAIRKIAKGDHQAINERRLKTSLDYLLLIPNTVEVDKRL